MNHEVKHNIYIQRPRCEHAKPMNFKEHGPCNDTLCGANSRIEPFEMPDLRHATASLRNPDQFISFRERRHKRLLNKDINSALH